MIDGKRNANHRLALEGTPSRQKHRLEEPTYTPPVGDVGNMVIKDTDVEQKIDPGHESDE